MKVKSESEVVQSCPTLSDPMDCSLPGYSIHGIFQARVLEWGAIDFSKRHIKFMQNFFPGLISFVGIFRLNVYKMLSNYYKRELFLIYLLNIKIINAF